MQVGMGGGVSLSTNSSRLYGGGSGSGDANALTLSSVSPHVLNRETYVSHYYTPDGYAALGVVNVTSGGDITRYFPASWSTVNAFPFSLLSLSLFSFSFFWTNFYFPP